MLYRFKESAYSGEIGWREATPEDLAADPAVQALVADAVRREREDALSRTSPSEYALGRRDEREAVVAWLKKRPGSTDGYSIDHGAHNHTETDR